MIHFLVNWKSDLIDYLFSHFKQNYEIVMVPAYHDSFGRRIAHFLWRFNICIRWNFYGNDFNHYLRSIPSGDIVVIITFFPEPTLNIVPQLCKNVKVIIWLWDSISVIGDSKIVSKLKMLNRPIATFDQVDAARNELTFIPQFFNFEFDNQYNLSPISDVYLLFSPKIKYRKLIYHEICSYLSSTSLSCHFICVDYQNQSPISYYDNIENIKKTRCILDIVHDGQSGLSIRPMEALAFKKKLITTNVHIVDYDFYSPENIFIWGVDDLESLESFVRSPYKPIAKKMISQYDINEWCKKLQSL